MKKAKYQQWIDAIEGDVTNKCAEKTLEMQVAFPELTRVRGFYHCVLLGPRPHWWLVSEDGDIIDPTARQFAPCGEYEEWDETRPEPTGMCPNCGGYCYDSRSVCSDKCSREFMMHLNEARIR